jgi:tetraacyldisaccharide 4'-kinase
MKFLKPKFWDSNKISFYSIALYPISILIKAINFAKYLTIRRQKVSIPVICVGNIYLGGTGKTPLCSELYNILKDLNKKPVFIKKKYEGFEDETNLLKKIGPIYEDIKRIDALNEATKNKFDVAILDDGFQDFSIKKNLSIICFNEKQWIGNGFVIPAGPLRESLTALKRADYVMINGKKNINIEDEIYKNNKLIKIFYSKYIPLNINDFKNQKIICFAGIGNPKNFFDILKENNIDMINQISFPDHYRYSVKELDDLIKKAIVSKALLLTTEKDYLRINKEYRKNINYLKIRLKLENEFIYNLKKII